MATTQENSALVHLVYEPLREPTPEEALHAVRLSAEARMVRIYRRPLLTRLRRLHRLLAGVWTEEQTLAMLPAVETAADLRELLEDELTRSRRPEAVYWAGERPEEPTVIAQARRLVETETARADYLVWALSWRLKAALDASSKHAVTEAALSDLGMTPDAWAGFCAVEDARLPADDGDTTDPGVIKG